MSQLQTILVRPGVILDGEAAPGVNLRDLHQALSSTQHFSDWSKNRLKESQADEGADYVIHKSMANLKADAPFLIAGHIPAEGRAEKEGTIRSPPTDGDRTLD